MVNSEDLTRLEVDLLDFSDIVVIYLPPCRTLHEPNCKLCFLINLLVCTLPNSEYYRLVFQSICILVIKTWYQVKRNL